MWPNDTAQPTKTPSGPNEDFGSPGGASPIKAGKFSIVSVADWGVTPSGQDFDTVKITNEINLFNDVIREESTNSSVRFVDITDISRKALNDEIYIAEDGLHFSGAMYKLWAEEIARGF